MRFETISFLTSSNGRVVGVNGAVVADASVVGNVVGALAGWLLAIIGCVVAGRVVWKRSGSRFHTEWAVASQSSRGCDASTTFRTSARGKAMYCTLARFGIL